MGKKAITFLIIGILRTMGVNLFPNNKLISQKLDLNVPERRFLLYIITYFENYWEDILRTKNVFLKLTIKIQPT